MDINAKLICETIENNKSTQLNLLEELCNIDSGSGNIKGNKELVEIIKKQLQLIGAEIEEIYNPYYGTHILARINKGIFSEKLILAAHLDTVFKEGDAKKHPFRVDGEFAYGLGVADCKGGVVTILTALKTLVKANLMPKKEIVIIFNCDEEVGSPSSKELFKKEATNAMAVLSFEPGRKRNGILTSRYGLAEGKIVVSGKSAHACLDNGPGVNAIVELANVIINLNKQDDDSNGIHYNVSPISGGRGPSVVADKAEGEFWVTFKSFAAYEQIKKYILEDLPNQKANSESEIITELNLLFPPMERSEQNILLHKQISDIAAKLNIELPEEMSKSPADCNFYADFGTPTVDGLGPYMFNIHTVEEHIIVSSLYERTKLAANLIREL
ncbi:M20/M25/M40 family metallo-hydrolase [Chryseomicrobium aureum]|uniref:M20/M25/M40 family metallo-hydrolase n=1 Tax=Chryseomicrobium aureum TaxID=1441723 RepID=UPI00370D01D2